MSFVQPQTASITISQSDIETICKIGNIAWENYFSRPLPGYNEMKVYWEGKIQLFHTLARKDQLKIIESAHGSPVSHREIQKLIKSNDKQFKTFVTKFIGINKDRLLSDHGIAHHVRTAIIAQLACQQYFENFVEFERMTPRVLFCALSAALLHDIGRCFGGDMYDVFGPLSAEIAEDILSEVGGFSDIEIGWIKEVVDTGGLNESDIDKLSDENRNFLNEKELIACLVGDADSYEFERFFDEDSCNIEYTSIKKLCLLTKERNDPDEILNALKDKALSLSRKISEPETSDSQVNHIEFLRDELCKLNK